MIRFIYTGDLYDRTKEMVVENIFRIMSEMVALPENIEIEFKQLAVSVYGETLLDHRYKNRIRLHEGLSSREVILPLIHELLHLNQIHTGKLSGRRDGSFLWNGKVYQVSKVPTLGEWSQLPWEVEVAEQEKQFLVEVLRRA